MVANASPKRRHVDAEQLELGGHVGAGERTRAVEQRVDDDLGHRVAGRDQAVHPPARRRALADREDVRVGGAALLVDQHAAALGDLEPGRPGPAASRGRMPAENTTTSASIGLAVGERRARSTAPVARRRPPSVAAPVCTVTPSCSMWRTRVRAAGLVELHRHQPRRHLDDVGLQAELDQGVGGLEAEQPAADHRADACAGPAASRIASRSSMVR